jgi:hypothetical protein
MANDEGAYSDVPVSAFAHELRRMVAVQAEVDRAGRVAMRNGIAALLRRVGREHVSVDSRAFLDAFDSPEHPNYREQYQRMGEQTT